jgi:hypothetical protein
VTWLAVGGLVVLVGLIAVDLGNRWRRRRRLASANRSALDWLRWRADRAREVRRSPDPPWPADLQAVVEDKRARLDGCRRQVEARDGLDPDLAGAARELASAYDDLRTLAERVDRYASARTWPHPELDELLAARGEAGEVTPTRPDPPAPRHLTRLANELERLDAGLEEVSALLAAAPPTGSEEVLALLDEHVDRYERLSEAARRAWGRMFPEKAAEARAAGEAALEEARAMQELNRQLHARVRNDTARRKEKERRRREAQRRRGNGFDWDLFS